MIDTISPYSNQQGKSNKKKTAVVIAVVLILAALVGGIFMLRQSKKTSPTKVAVVNQEPSPTEKPKIDKQTVKIQVLNGTGTPGQAGVAVADLVKAGYNLDNIKTANATDFNNTVTSLTARVGFEAIASDVSNALKTTFSEVSIETTPFDEKSGFDVIVITGGKKAEVTPTTTVAPSQNPSPSPTTTTTAPTLTPNPTLSPTHTP
jgi:flagellar basal body-associated protein FliL